MHTKSLRLVLVVSLFTIAVTILSGCTRQSSEGAEPLQTTGSVTQTSYMEQITVTEQSEYDAYIMLNDGATTVSGSNASFENNTLSITSSGSYYIKGSLTDGRIYVNSADEEKKVRLFLDGVSVSCSYDAPLFIENSPDETVIILADSSVNSFSDTSREIPQDTADYATAAVYSKDDLQLEGGGELIVEGNFGKGIFSKNDIDIRGGIINIVSVDDGIRGKDSLEIEDCSLNITSGGDGIRTSEELEADKGDITVNSGNINIVSSLDGIQATGNVYINGGNVTVTSSGGSTEDYAYQEQGWGNPFAGGDFSFGDRATPDGSLSEESGSETPSTKGIKADKSITVNGGTIVLDCLDDSIHASYVTVNGGTVTASSDDDGIHGDENVTVNGGSVTITNSYEGVEGRTVNINGGYLAVKSADDGFNAASSDSSSSDAEMTQTAMGGFGGFGGFGGMDYDSSCMITVKDGFVYLEAQGDGIDSNGSVDMQGGTLIVFGPTNGGNGALDYGGSFTVSGGTLLATGSLGMAQSVTGNGVGVLNFNIDGTAGNVYTVSDSGNNCLVSFTTVKQFENVVFASDRLISGETYDVYEGGAVASYSQNENGIYLDGIYTPGQLLATLS